MLSLNAQEGFVINVKDIVDLFMNMKCVQMIRWYLVLSFDE